MTTPRTQLPPPGDARTLYVIDISGYVFRAYHALPPLASPKGEPSHAVLGVTSMLLKLVAEQKPAMLAVAMDSKKKSFRHDLYPEYKANRPPPPPDLGQQMARVREIVEAYAIPVLQQEGVEADDMIASVVRAAREQGFRVVIVSADKDLLQLIEDDVLMYDTGRNLVFGAKETEEKLGVPPGLVRDYLALVGDSSDNVPGVPSVGPKTAVQLIQEHGSLEGIYAELEQVAKKGLREKLKEHKDSALLSQQLVTLRADLPVVLDARSLAFHGADVSRLRALFQELGFTRLLRELPDAGAAASPPPSAAGTALPEPVNDAQGQLDLRAAQVGSAVPSQLECTTISSEAELRAFAGRLAASDRFGLVSVLDSGRAVEAGLVGLILVPSEAAPGYLPIGHTYLGHPEQVALAKVLEVLSPLLAAKTPKKLCADAKREAIILARNGIALDGVDFDLALASYLVDAERHGHTLRELAAELGLADLTAASAALLATKDGTHAGELEIDATTRHAGGIASTLGPIHANLAERLLALGCTELLRDMELPLAFVLAEMERTGITVDAQQLSRLSSQVAGQLVTIEAKCKQLAGHDFNVGSPRQLEVILFDELGLPVVKRTKTARSTDADVLEELALAHELPAAILEHRMLAKLKNTYLDALPREINPSTGRVHTDLRQTVAATGRLSSNDPNLQNIPVRSEIGRSIRLAFVPRPGFRMLVADYSQIELRVLAHLSRDPQLLDAYAHNLDVHARTARALFQIAEADVTREMRAQAKTVNFAVIYGQTQFALARNLRIERSQAAQYIKAFFEQYAGVKRYMDEVVDKARREGVTHTVFGRVRKVPDLNSKNRQLREAAERVARNTPIQGTAADIIKLAMVAIGKALDARGLQSKMLLSVHDELIFEAPENEEAELERLVVELMQGAAKMDVPLLVDHGWGSSWGDAK